MIPKISSGTYNSADLPAPPPREPASSSDANPVDPLPPVSYAYSYGTQSYVNPGPCVDASGHNFAANANGFVVCKRCGRTPK